MKNIELKAKYPDLEQARVYCRQLEAKFQWRKKQLDTYFLVKHGRLKLRQSEGERAELISYFRTDQSSARESNYRILTVEDGDSLREMLAEGLGILTVVSKIRTMYLYHNVRIHLDEVENLGNFLEFEGVLTQHEDREETSLRLDFLIRYFAISSSELIKYSYSDLMGQGRSRIMEKEKDEKSGNSK